MKHTNNKSLALRNIHPSTLRLDYHIRPGNSLHQLHIDPLIDPLSPTWPPCRIKVADVPTATYYQKK